MNLWPLLTTFVIIAAAELGDKTQLLTLSFAACFPAWEVIAAVTSATAVLMALAVIFGGAINYLIPEFYLQLLAGIIFIGFGIWTILSNESEKNEEKLKGRNPFWLVFTTFFLAELGDKTQLATLTLSAEYGLSIQVWLGATLGMVGVNAVAALAGNWIKQVVSEKHIKWIGAAGFIIFGLITLGKLIVR